MKDNVLKKEFAKKDVQRLRNVMTGKAGERSTDGIGYTKKQEVRHPENYKMFKRCFDCQATFEMKLKHKGLWDEYQKEIDNAALENIQDHMKNWLNSALNESNEGWVSEAGEIQNWKGGVNKKLAQQSLEETIEYLESLKK